MQSSSSPCYDFVAACIPYAAALGPIRAARMVQTLVKRESGPVTSLEKLAALRIVDNAMTAPMKRKELIEMIGKIEISSFSSLLFGDCPSVTQFISEHAHIHPHFCISLGTNRVRVTMNDGTLLVWDPQEVPVEKILEVMEVVLKKKPLILFTLVMHADIPNTIFNMINEAAVDMIGGRFATGGMIHP